MVSSTLLSLWLFAQPLVGGEARAHSTAGEAHAGHRDVPGKTLPRTPATGVQTDTAPTSAMPSQEVSQTPTIAQATRLLMAVDVLSQDQRKATSLDIQSPVLCYCLAKAPATIQELRRVAAEWFSHGLVSFTAQQYEEAIAAFTKAIQLHPRGARAYTNRGLAYSKVGRYQPAIEDLSTAIALDPRQAEAYYIRSLTALLVGDEQQALQDGRLAAQLGYPPALRLFQATDRLPVTGVLDERAQHFLEERQ